MQTLQIPDGLMNFMIVVAVIYAVQTTISLGYFILEITRDGRDHSEADAEQEVTR
jgi:hypothetical protein